MSENWKRFYIVPQALITDKRFKSVSCGAKLLYGILLDRRDLSVANNWIDDCKRTYIFYTVASIMEVFDCSKNTAMKFLSELEAAGLISRKKQGQHYPDKIYVNDFLKTEFKTSAKQNLRIPKNGSLGAQNLNPNHTDKNNTEFNYTEIISYPIISKRR